MFPSIFSGRRRILRVVALPSLVILLALPTALFLRGQLSPEIMGQSRAFAASAVVPKPASTPTPTRPKEKPLHPEGKLLGKYYFGDGLGVNCSLDLESKNRFTFRWTGCLGEYDRNTGIWRQDGDMVLLSPEKPNKREGFQGMNLRFVPVLWGKQCFLVDEYEMPGFCATARDDISTLNRLHGHDYRRWVGSEPPPLQGKPLIPARYLTFYEKGAVEAKVIRQEGNRFVLDKGSADRVIPGMRFALNNFGGSELVVVSCQEHESIAQPFYYWNTDEPVKVGERFTTGSYWHRPRGTGFERFPELPKPIKQP